MNQSTRKRVMTASIHFTGIGSCNLTPGSAVKNTLKKAKAKAHIPAGRAGMLL